jgi:hypothetical protein
VERLHFALEAVPPLHIIRLFRTGVYLCLLLNTLFLLPVADSLWGSNSLVAPISYPGGLLYRLYYFLMPASHQQYYWLFFVFQVSGIALFLSGVWRRFAMVLIFVATTVLFARAHTYTTGGHSLIVLFLFYFIFIGWSEKSRSQNVLSNLFFMACKIQFALVYLFAGLYKLQGTYWLSGEALTQVLSLREFSHPWLQQWVLPQQYLLKAGTWAALLYQLIFPVAIWFKLVKKPLILFGIFFHLFIAFGMGLPDFGLFMVVSYLMFLDEKTAQKIVQRLQSMGQFFQSSLKRG